MPLGGPSANSQACIDAMRTQREAAGRPWDGFGIQAQAQFAGGTPERWHAHAEKWQAMGATHLVVATHNAGETDVDGHLARFESYMAAVDG